MSIRIHTITRTSRRIPHCLGKHETANLEPAILEKTCLSPQSRPTLVIVCAALKTRAVDFASGEQGEHHD